MSKLLIKAITINNRELIKELLDNGADVNAAVAERTYNGFRALHIAASQGKTEVVSLLVNEFGVDVNAAVAEGFYAGSTALHIAANCGKTEVVSLLVNEFGVDVNAAVAEGFYAGKSALHIAAGYGSTETVSVLLESGCVIDDSVTSIDPGVNNLLSKYRNANNHVDDGESLAYVNDLAFAIFNALRPDPHSNVKPDDSMLNLFKYKDSVGESSFTLEGYELSESPCYIFYADLLSDYTKSLLNKYLTPGGELSDAEIRSLKVSMYVACEEYIASVPEAQLIAILQEESSIVVDPSEFDFNSMTSELVLTPVSMIIDFLLSPVIERDLFDNEIYDVLSNANAILLGESE